MDDIAMARLGTRQYNYGYNTKNQLSEIGTPAIALTATNFGLLNCNDYALLADLEGVVVNPPATGTPPGQRHWSNTYAQSERIAQWRL